MGADRTGCPVLQQTFVVLDFETSGGDVVETGAVRMVGGEVRARFHELSRPSGRISSTARAHGITDEALEGRSTFLSALPELLEFLGEAVVVAHNAPFDRAVLTCALRRGGREPLSNPFVDTLRLSRRFFPEAPAHDLETLSWFHRIRRLARHRALQDALATADLFRVCLERAREEGVETTQELLALGACPPPNRAEEPIQRALDDKEQRLLEEAAGTGDRLEIEYRTEGGTRRKVVVPYGVEAGRGSPRLIAYDLASGKTRTLRLDRVLRVGPPAGD